jgi:hypothetical protein
MEILAKILIFCFVGWFAYASTILVNEKKEKQRKKRAQSAPSRS